MIIRVSSLRLRTAVLLFLVALSAKAVAAHQETPEKFATVTGVVIDSRTDRPIANAQVYLELGRLAEVPSNYKRVTATGVTDLEGHFQFVSVMPRVYTLIVKKGGYLVSPIHVVEVDREVVLLKDHIRLDAAARVFGLVVNDTGRAVPNARVVAVLPPVLQSSSLVRLLNEGGVTALTRTCNGQGRFVIVLPVDQPGMSLFAEARGYAPGIVSLGREGVLADRKEVVIRLPAGFTAHGRIRGRCFNLRCDHQSRALRTGQQRPWRSKDHTRL